MHIHMCVLTGKSYCKSGRASLCRYTLIITAVIAVIRGTDDIPRENCSLTTQPDEKREEGGEKKMCTLTRSVFVISSMDTKILSQRQGDNWLTNGRTPLPRSFARNYAPRFRETLCMSHALTTVARHEYQCKIRSPRRRIVDPGEPPVYPSISPIDGSTSRGLRYSWTRGQICEQSRRLLDISPSQNDRNIQGEMYNTIIIT